MITDDFALTIITGTDGYSVDNGRVAVAYRTYATDARDVICGELRRESTTDDWTAITTGAFGYIAGYPADRIGQADTMIGAMALLAEWARELVESERAYVASGVALRSA